MFVGQILTETDFVELAAAENHPANTTVADCMSFPVTTVNGSTRPGDAAKLMSEDNTYPRPGLWEPSYRFFKYDQTLVPTIPGWLKHPVHLGEAGF